MKKWLKRIGKCFLGLIGTVILADLAWIYVPQLRAQQKIADIEQFAQHLADVDLSDDVQLIGLGEATHGNAEFQTLRLDMLKVLVEREQVRAFALEADFAEGLAINRYIQGRSDNLDELVKNSSFTIYRTKQMKALIQWMHDYNQGKSDSEKLAFYGFDLQNPEKGIDFILDYAQKTSYADEAGLVEILKPVTDSSTSYKSLDVETIRTRLETFKTSIDQSPTDLEAQLLSQEISNVLNGLDYYKDMTDDYVTMNTVRDRMMAANVQWIQSFEKERSGGKVLLSGHNGHVAKQEKFFPNMGSQLKGIYGQAYFVIGTDYFSTKVNINEIGHDSGRSVQGFNSADPLAAQAKALGGAYYLNFSSVDKESSTANFVNQAINMGNLGEGYSFLMHLIPTSVRTKAVPSETYDAMYYFYQTTPIDLLATDQK